MYLLSFDNGESEILSRWDWISVAVQCVSGRPLKQKRACETDWRRRWGRQNSVDHHTGYELLDILYQLDAPNGTVSPVEYCTLGMAPTSTVFVIKGQSAFPVTEPGFIVIAEAPLFIRGDGTGDGMIDLADPIFNLNHLFQMGPSICLSAQDTNDDGAVDMADPVYNLMYLFAMGPPPPTPFPACGVDLTVDPLDCAEFTQCP